MARMAATTSTKIDSSAAELQSTIRPRSVTLERLTDREAERQPAAERPIARRAVAGVARPRALHDVAGGVGRDRDGVRRRHARECAANTRAVLEVDGSRRLLVRIVP